MTDHTRRTERLLRLSSVLVIIGLAGQVLTLFWNHPLAFLGFMFLASPLVLAGILIYLYAVLTTSSPASEGAQ